MLANPIEPSILQRLTRRIRQQAGFHRRVSLCDRVVSGNDRSRTKRLAHSTGNGLRSAQPWAERRWPLSWVCRCFWCLRQTKSRICGPMLFFWKPEGAKFSSPSVAQAAIGFCAQLDIKANTAKNGAFGWGKDGNWMILQGINMWLIF